MPDFLQPSDLVYDALGRLVGEVGDVHQDLLKARRQGWASGNTWGRVRKPGDPWVLRRGEEKQGD